jgi:aspartyl-tRNA(Asn)/glutamyl-tRNA(Gln) amidotransferase subunit C
MAISREDVRHIAQLARLRFSDDGEAQMADEMGRILGHVDKLSELDTTGVPPMSHVLDIHNVFREDEVEQRIDHEDALRNAPDADSDYFRVPKVID